VTDTVSHSDTYAQTLAQTLGAYTILPERPHTSPAGVTEALAKLGVVGHAEMTIDRDKFAAYQALTSYQTAFPKYFTQFGKPETWERKQLEHYISVEVLAPKPGGVYVDVAAAGSPVAAVMRSHYGARAYGQDIRWAPGVDENLWRIGSNASEIPLPDGSVDGIVTHNAIEHFEDHYDRGFMIECGRLLKSGGVVCIIPFVPMAQGYSVTAPAFWQIKFGAGAADPVFDPRLPLVLDDGCKQRLLKVHSAQTLSDDCAMASALTWTLVQITNAADFGFQRAMLIGRKP
jgi:SAM-dependent methyltransferase